MLRRDKRKRLGPGSWLSGEAQAAQGELCIRKSDEHLDNSAEDRIYFDVLPPSFVSPCLYHKGLLNFVKDFLCIYRDNHVISVFEYIMMDYIFRLT